MKSLKHIYKAKTVAAIFFLNLLYDSLITQKAYNKLDIVVNIAVCTHFNVISILAS